jgi:sulfur relay (sulfurtransferase) DsrF/TusC family protein
MGKRITFLIRSTPFRNLNNYEAMRAAIAFYDHELTVVWMGDGIFYPLKKTNKGNTQPILRLFKDLNIRLLVDADELTQRGYTSKDIIAEAEPVPQNEILEAVIKADSVLTF